MGACKKNKKKTFLMEASSEKDGRGVDSLFKKEVLKN